MDHRRGPVAPRARSRLTPFCHDSSNKDTQQPTWMYSILMRLMRFSSGPPCPRPNVHIPWLIIHYAPPPPGILHAGHTHQGSLFPRDTYARTHKCTDHFAAPACTNAKVRDKSGTGTPTPQTHKHKPHPCLRAPVSLGGLQIVHVHQTRGQRQAAGGEAQEVGAGGTGRAGGRHEHHCGRAVGGEGQGGGAD